MSNSNPSPSVECSQNKADDDPEKDELRRKLLEMIKRREMIRREKPR